MILCVVTRQDDLPKAVVVLGNDHLLLFNWFLCIIKYKLSSNLIFVLFGNFCFHWKEILRTSIFYLKIVKLKKYILRQTSRLTAVWPSNDVCTISDTWHYTWQCDLKVIIKSWIPYVLFDKEHTLLLLLCVTYICYSVLWVEILRPALSFDVFCVGCSILGDWDMC